MRRRYRDLAILENLTETFTMPEYYSGTLVLLFYGRRCPNCREVLKWWNRVVKLCKGHAVFMAIPYTRHLRRVVESVGVSYLPALLIVKDGIIVERLEPVRRAEELEAAIISNVLLVP